MKRMISSFLLLMLITFGIAVAEEAAPRSIVVYFSRAGENYNVGSIDEGNTAKLAKIIAEQTGAELFAIEPETPYPMEYDATLTIATEEKNTDARPAYVGNIENWGEIDTIYLGYPIWWGGVPQIVFTFIDDHDFTNKTIVPFNTHEGSGHAGTYEDLSAYLPDVTFLQGLAVRGSKAHNDAEGAAEDVSKWLTSIGLAQ